MTLPVWLKNEPAPKILREAMALYGTIETPGAGNNPVIMGWAKEVGSSLGIEYSGDSVPWCGLFMSVCAKRAGYDIPDISIRAKSWMYWGYPIGLGHACLGDVLVFEREGGGHVAQYTGHDSQGFFHVIGGNQSDAVTRTRIAMSRCIAIRRTPFINGQPPTVRPILVAPSGEISHNES